LDESLGVDLPPDEDSPFPSPWVFSRHRQEVLCNTFFSRLTPGQSLVFFYTKSGHPLDEAISRLVVGVGQLQSVSKLLLYDSSERHTYPLWDRLFTHSIRPDGDEGFLIPYHDYLQATGDPNEDERRHTEALVQAHQWCSDDCRVHETLFLRKTKGRWRVVERIPEEVMAGSSPYGRYLGPIGTTPKESEIISIDRPGTPSEATARADVYRIVLDTLYSVNSERPKRIVLTNWFWTSGGIPTHSSTIDTALVKRFSVLGAIRAPFDAISKYRVPISTLPLDSVPALRERGAALDVGQTGYPFWVAFANKYRGAWGMLGVSRIAFNANRSQALVSTYHACGNSCVSRDTWFLTRSGKTWQITDRIPSEAQSNVEVEPLRYVGADVSPIAYRPRRVQGVITDAETGKAMANFTVRVRRRDRKSPAHSQFR
jgi:hypothetical protein